MAHSNRINLHWLFVGVEVAIFAGALLATYLSETQSWGGFLTLSIGAVVLYGALRVRDAWPRAQELMVREDMAAKIANAAIPYGMADYYNMQDSSDQSRRNEATQRSIRDSKQMWLCANSGASYLDPSLYRHWPAVERQLRSGIEFRVVLLDPVSAEKRFRNLINVNGEQFDAKLNIPNLIRLYNEYPTLEVRFVSVGMHATVFATESCLYVDPYHVGTVGGRIENRSMCMKFVPSEPPHGVSMYRLFKSHLDTLWRASVPFDAWLAANRVALPPELPALAARIG